MGDPYDRRGANPDYSAFVDSRDDGVMESQQRDIARAMQLIGVPGIVDTAAAAVGNEFDERRLIPFNSTLQEGMTPEQMRKVPQASFDAGIYADMITLQIPLLNGISQRALLRPMNTRILLIIINNAAANLFVAFGQDATAASLPIPPGGALFFDAAVPQNDVSLYYVGANVNVPIFYMNSDIANVST